MAVTVGASAGQKKGSEMQDQESLFRFGGNLALVRSLVANPLEPLTGPRMEREVSGRPFKIYPIIKT
jgi:hypothetical protein